jgi:flagellar export protein FliJ
MPFRFRFQSMLKQRRFLLEEAQTACAAAQAKCNRIASEIEGMKAAIANQWRLWEEKQQKGITAMDYLTSREYIDALERQLQIMEEQMIEAVKELSEKKEIVIQRDVGVKMLETLEGQDREVYRYAQGRKEQKQLDDVAVFKDFRDRTEFEKV